MVLPITNNEREKLLVGRKPYWLHLSIMHRLKEAGSLFSNSSPRSNSTKSYVRGRIFLNLA